MGNCIGHQKAVTWVDDDDWEAVVESPMHYSRKEGEAEEMVEKEKGSFEGKGSGVASTEVKVKISKKQLEELLQRVEGKGLPIQQVLTDLLSMGEAALQEREQQWRPVLQSIPEFPE